VKRRELMLLLGAAMVAARTLRAQQKAMAVVGYLNGGSPPLSVGHGPVHQGLSEAGWVEGQNMAIEYRWAEDHYDRLPALAADLVSRKVDVIVAVGGTPEAIAAKSATSTIPIVFTGASDPVGAGLVASFSRPGRNLTGFSPMNIELMAKRFEMLTEVVPQVRVIALLVNPNNQTTEAVIRAVQEAARVKGVQLPILKASTEEEIDAAFATIAELRAGGLVVGSDSFLAAQREQLAALALHYAVPAIDQDRSFAASGGLISYGRNVPASLRQAGVYAGRILKGEKPADLPVQQPTIFDLVVNLKTAEALGVTVPPSILARADEVIE
jgi:putative ABC transport system substrate-binding protein